jgi:hypothetical protein
MWPKANIKARPFFKIKITEKKIKTILY